MTDRKLPLYQCHKQVRAGEIIMIDRGETSRLYFAKLDVAFVDVPRSWMDKHKPEVGGYFVEYEDGYQSYSPGTVFLSGYKPIDTIDKAVDFGVLRTTGDDAHMTESIVAALKTAIRGKLAGANTVLGTLTFHK